MKQKVLTYVKRYHPAFYKSDFFETHGIDGYVPFVSMTETKKVAENIKNCFGFYVYKQEYFIFEGKRFEAKPEKIKSIIFGRVVSIEDIEAMPDFYRKSHLLEKLAKEHQDKAIQTRTGAWLDIEDEKDAEIIYSKPYF